MSVNFYIARPTYCFILMYNCGLTVKRVCYVMTKYRNFYRLDKDQLELAND